MKSKLYQEGFSTVNFLGCVLSSTLLLSNVFAQTAPSTSNAAANGARAASIKPSSTRKVSPYRPLGMPSNARDSYQVNWGVDSMGVKSVESGLMIRFNYRVVNAEKAQPLNDKKANPFLVDQKTHVKLVVPTLEKVGQLRQSSAAEVGKTYWMVFSNKGNYVKRGDPVTVVIGKFRVDGLVVE